MEVENGEGKRMVSRSCGVRNGRVGRKRKRCEFDSCEKYAIKGGVCVAHGAQTQRCKVDNCEKQAIKGGVCVAHGAQKKRCKVDNCEKYAVKGGVCIAHVAQTKRCKVDNCEKYAHKVGGCMAHGSKRKRHEMEGGDKKPHKIRRRVTRSSVQAEESRSRVIRPTPVRVNVHPPNIVNRTEKEKKNVVKVKEEPVCAGVWTLHGSLRREYTSR